MLDVHQHRIINNQLTLWPTTTCPYFPTLARHVKIVLYNQNESLNVIPALTTHHVVILLITVMIDKHNIL